MATDARAQFLDGLRVTPEHLTHLQDRLYEAIHDLRRAYRLLFEGEDLPSWHPLVSGRRDSVQRAGLSISSYAIKENQVRRLEDHIIKWLD